MFKPLNKHHKPTYLAERENQGTKKSYRRMKNKDFAKGIELDGRLEGETEFSYDIRY
jgi:hypothetical protein